MIVDAVRAGAVTHEKARQDIHGDIGAGAAYELAIALDRIPQGNDREAGVRIDRGLGDHKRSGFLRLRVARQSSDIQCRSAYCIGRRRAARCRRKFGAGRDSCQRKNRRCSWNASWPTAESRDRSACDRRRSASRRDGSRPRSSHRRRRSAGLRSTLDKETPGSARCGRNRDR